MSETFTGVNKSQEVTLLRGFALRAANLISRVRMNNALGSSHGGKRNLYEVFGWPYTISLDEMWEMYHRGGIAKRLIDAYPKAIWARPPRLYIANNDAWNTQWAGFAEAYDVWKVFRRLDTLTRLGRFGLLVIGTDKGDLGSPQKKNANITYMQPYGEKDVKVHTYETNQSSPRFGKPLMYQIYPPKATRTIQGVTSTAPVKQSFLVHWTRCIHVAYSELENEDFGTPMYGAVWNNLIDLQKVVGASSESFWLNSFPGLHANVDKEMDLEPDDEKNLTDEIDEYANSFRRYIRTRGVDVKAIGGSIANPGQAFDVLLTLIAGTVGLPKRVLIGSEAGQLASTQDKGNWAERVEEERSDYAEPGIIRKFMRWVNEYSTMPVDLTNLQVLWPEAYRMSPLERAQQGAQIARSLANLYKGMQPVELEPEVVGTPATPASTDPVTGVVTPATPGTPGKPAVTAEPILTRDEARKIIGLSNDQNLFEETPD